MNHFRLLEAPVDPVLPHLSSAIEVGVWKSGSAGRNWVRQMSWDGTWNRIKVLVESALVSADVTGAAGSIAAAR